MLDVQGFDHLVLRCNDVETTLAWYVERLGMPPVRVDEWRDGVAPFPSVRVDEGTIIDLVPASDVDGASGHLEHICLVVGEGAIDVVAADPAFNVVDGPGPRFGARGVATSVYVTDPDGLTVEFRTYPLNTEDPLMSKESEQ
jgi:catechol 2,3-dioxygenase-like lactoylglutathione lyase family enzyme